MDHQATDVLDHLVPPPPKGNAPNSDALNGGSPNGGAPTPAPIVMKKVSSKVRSFHTKMGRIAQFLKDNGADEDLLIDEQDLLMQFYIDRKSLARLATIASQDDFDRMGVFFALEDTQTNDPLDPATSKGFGRMTCCFAGLTKDTQVMGAHFQTNASAILAEDTWPPDPPPPPVPTRPKALMSLQSASGDVLDYFLPPNLAQVQISPQTQVPAQTTNSIETPPLNPQ